MGSDERSNPNAPGQRQNTTTGPDSVKGFANRLRNTEGNLAGCLWALIAALFFTIMLALIKELGQRLHVTQIIFIRQTIMMLIVAPAIIRALPGPLHTQFPALHGLRIILACTAMLAGFTAVVHLPIAEFTAIGFSRSFFITILAIAVLREFVGIHRWGATLVGFIGIIVILRPTGEGALTYFGLLAVLGSMSAAGVMIILRKLTQHDRPSTILTYQALFVGLVMLPPAIWYWQTPTWKEVALLIGLGAMSWAGQMCNIRAQKAGESAVLATIDYTRLVYAGLLGWLLFAELPDGTAIAGALLILFAAIYTMRRELKKGRERTRVDDI